MCAACATESEAHTCCTLIRLPYVLALLSGALLALSFPRYGHPAFAWIALVPLLVALHGRGEAHRGLAAGPWG